MKLDSVYLILTHTYHPAEGAMTQKKEWGKMNEWRIEEHIKFEKGINDRVFDEASVILEYTNKSIIKDRVKKHDFNGYINHIAQSFPNEFKSFKDNYDRYAWAMEFREKSMKEHEEERKQKDVENFVKRMANEGKIPESFTLDDVKGFKNPQINTSTRKTLIEVEEEEETEEEIEADYNKLQDLIENNIIDCPNLSKNVIKYVADEFSPVKVMIGTKFGTIIINRNDIDPEDKPTEEEILKECGLENAFDNISYYLHASEIVYNRKKAQREQSSIEETSIE